MNNIYVGMKLYCLKHGISFEITSFSKNNKHYSMMMWSDDSLSRRTFHDEVTIEMINEQYVDVSNLSEDEIIRKIAIIKLKS